MHQSGRTGHRHHLVLPSSSNVKCHATNERRRRRMKTSPSDLFKHFCIFDRKRRLLWHTISTFSKRERERKQTRESRVELWNNKQQNFPAYIINKLWPNGPLWWDSSCKFTRTILMHFSFRLLFKGRSWRQHSTYLIAEKNIAIINRAHPWHDPKWFSRGCVAGSVTRCKTK